MASAARGLAGELRGAVDRAADAGRWALVVVAVLAVGREGLETALFLWAATNAATRDAIGTVTPTWEPLLGAALGIATAVVIGLPALPRRDQDQPRPVLLLDRRLPHLRRRRRAVVRRPRPAGGRLPARPPQPGLRRLATWSTRPLVRRRPQGRPQLLPADHLARGRSPGCSTSSITLPLFIVATRRRAAPTTGRSNRLRPSDRRHTMRPTRLLAALRPRGRARPRRLHRERRPELRRRRRERRPPDHRRRLRRRLRPVRDRGAGRQRSRST